MRARAGMAAEGVVEGVRVWRPWLAHDKSEIFAFARRCAATAARRADPPSVDPVARDARRAARRPQLRGSSSTVRPKRAASQRHEPPSRDGFHLYAAARLPPDTPMYSLLPPRGPPLIELPRPSPRDSGARPPCARTLLLVSLIRVLMM